MYFTVLSGSVDSNDGAREVGDEKNHYSYTLQILIIMADLF